MQYTLYSSLNFSICTPPSSSKYIVSNITTFVKGIYPQIAGSIHRFDQELSTIMGKIVWIVKIVSKIRIFNIEYPFLFAGRPRPAQNNQAFFWNFFKNRFKIKKKKKIKGKPLYFNLQRKLSLGICPALPLVRLVLFEHLLCRVLL